MSPMPHLCAALAAALILAGGLSPKLSAQALTGYTLKAGPTLAMQRWNDFDRDPLLGYHADLQVERIDFARPTSFYASLGYHQRGSAIRTRATRFVDPVSGEERVFRPESIRFVFHNLALALGGKQHYSLGAHRGFVSFALRGEYNLATDLGDGGAGGLNFGYGTSFPVPEFTRDVLYGADLGVGAELALGARADALVELRLSPDMSAQYDQPALRFSNVVTGNNEVAAERTISNVSVELSVGLRFLPEAAFE